jgi:protein O-mannosyl-transferase
MRPQTKKRWLLVAAVIIVYATSLRGSFQFDDFNVIVDQPGVHGLQGWANGLGGIRPLLKATYLLNWYLGPGPFGFHVFNGLVHLVNSLLIFELGRRLLSDNPEQAGLDAAFFAALIFAIHPIQTEAVTYICGRSVSLMATFYLGSACAYIHGRLQKKSLWIYAISPGFFLLAALTRETALTLPIALLLWECLAPKAQQDGARRFHCLVVHTLLLLMLVLVGAWHAGYRHFFLYALSIRSLSLNLLSQLDAITYLLKRWIWPWPLNIDPGLPAATQLRSLLVIKALVLMGALSLLMSQVRRRPLWVFGGLWFLLHLMPTSSLMPRRDLVNERHLYLSTWGLAMVLCLGLHELCLHRPALRPFVRSSLALAVLALSLLTVNRHADYRSEVSLWSQSVAANPKNPRAHNNLGFAYAASGDLKAAQKCFKTALGLDPTYRPALENLNRLALAPESQHP